ncbi:MAG: peptidoglycan D,D-transpeptidase FtsI family protein [Actinomycetales bacterium]
MPRSTSDGAPRGAASGRDGAERRSSGQRRPGERAGAAPRLGSTSRPPARPPRRPAARRKLTLADSGRRLRIALGATLVLLLVFVGRLVQLQGISASVYAAEATTTTTVTVPAVRGTITDASGAPLATTVAAINVTADQTITSAKAATSAAKLAPVLGMTVADVQAKLTGSKRFVYLAKQITPELWRKVDGLHVAGIFSEKTSKRVYPEGTLAANLIGFVGADGSGLEGLEHSYDKTLAGRDGKVTYEAAGGRSVMTQGPGTVAAVPGDGLRLTLDRDIQWFAQQQIAKEVAAVKAKNGTVVVMDAATGRLLALATTPTYDANDPSKTPDAIGDPALAEAYEPGSTGKLITASALLEQGLISLDTKLTVPNRLARAGKSFKDFEEHGTEHLTYAGTIARSSNIGTILAAERMGDLTQMHDWLAKFGVGQSLGPQFPGATSGLLPPKASWSGTKRYTVTFGQGYSVNTVQMASVVATIANGGVRVAPSVIAGTTTPDGTFVPSAAPTKTRIVSQHTADEVTKMMQAVILPGGTAPSAAITGYNVAGKTGTAQRYDPSCGCYRGYTMSFIGFAPADASPSSHKIVVACTLQDPQSGSGGGSTCGPVFHQVLAFVLQSQDIPPTGAPAPDVPIRW